MNRIPYDDVVVALEELGTPNHGDDCGCTEAATQFHPSEHVDNLCGDGLEAVRRILRRRVRERQLASSDLWQWRLRIRATFELFVQLIGQLVGGIVAYAARSSSPQESDDDSEVPVPVHADGERDQRVDEHTVHSDGGV